MLSFLRIRHIREDNIKSAVMQNTIFRVGFSSINRIGQAVKHFDVAMSIASQNHIHFSDAGCIGDFVSVYCGLPQGFHISLGSCHIVMDISKALNKKTAGAAEWVINLLANLRIDQTHHCFYDVTGSKIFTQIILRGSRSLQKIFKSIAFHITVYIGKHERIKLIHNILENTGIFNL